MHTEAQILSKRQEKRIEEWLGEARKNKLNGSLESFMARRFEAIMSLEDIVFDELI